jgi:hypothetical protein
MRYFNINLLIEFHIIYSLKDIDRLFFSAIPETYATDHLFIHDQSMSIWFLCNKVTKVDMPFSYRLHISYVCTYNL